MEESLYLLSSAWDNKPYVPMCSRFCENQAKNIAQRCVLQEMSQQPSYEDHDEDELLVSGTAGIGLISGRAGRPLSPMVTIWSDHVLQVSYRMVFVVQMLKCHVCYILCTRNSVIIFLSYEDVLIKQKKYVIELIS